jgi:acyl-CoA synthetase (AMP-forming)/AMP-acid ligase II
VSTPTNLLNVDSLQEAFYRQLDADPDARCVTWYDRRAEVRWQTRSEFFADATGRAAQLRDAGLNRGEVCVIVHQSDPTSMATLVGTLLLGGLPLLVAPPAIQGVNSDLPRIVAGTVERTKAPVVSCSTTLDSMRAELEAGSPSTTFLFSDEIDVDADATLGERIMPGPLDRAAYQLTSGTTGFPKICVWKQEGVLAALDGMYRAMELGPDDVFFNWTPLYHDMGLVNNTFLCLAAGIPMVMYSPLEFVKNPASWLIGLQETGANQTWSPNFGFAITAQRARDKQLEGVRLDHVKGFWNAAERIHLDTMRAFADRFEPYGVTVEQLKTNFGCAENIGGATFSDPHGAYVHEHVNRDILQDSWIATPVPEDDPLATPIVSAGRPHPGMDIHILGDDGERLVDGEVGEVALESPSALIEYLEDPEATADAIRPDGLVLTGDLGYMRDGELFWTGRVRERITLRGKKFDPSDFEPALFDIADLRKGCFAAFGVDDTAAGTQKIVVVSEIRQPLERTLTDIEGDIRDATMTHLGVNVADVVLVEPGTLTKTSSGKRRHTHFSQMYLRGDLDPYIVSDGAPAKEGV